MTDTDEGMEEVLAIAIIVAPKQSFPNANASFLDISQLRSEIRRPGVFSVTVGEAKTLTRAVKVQHPGQD